MGEGTPPHEAAPVLEVEVAVKSNVVVQLDSEFTITAVLVCTEFGFCDGWTML